MPSLTRTAVLTTAAVIAFAANSLLCRAALRDDAIGATSFTAIRLATGAAVLMVVAQFRHSRVRGEGTWGSAAALVAYAVAFSFAFEQIGVASGALLLFGAVQLTMIVGGLLRSEHATPLQWLGWALAFAGLVTLNAPSLDRPPLAGALPMLAAGVAWGIYSLYGRGVTRPLAATTDNFVRTVPIAAGLAGIAIATQADVSPTGFALAASCGVVSGVGYVLWYAAVPALRAHRAAVVQLPVPVLSAAGAIFWFGEPLHTTVAIGGAAIVGGLAIALAASK